MTGLSILFMSLQPYALKNHQSDVQIAFIQSHESLIIVLRFIFASVRFNPWRPFWIWSPISSDLIAVELLSFDAVNKAEKDLWALHKWWSFPLRISLVNVTKSARNCNKEILNGKLHFLYSGPNICVDRFLFWKPLKYILHISLIMSTPIEFHVFTLVSGFECHFN